MTTLEQPTNQTFLRFPSDFLWGTATAAYQIEGAVDRDGRGPSIWDRLSHTPGAIADGSNGDNACEHYDRFESDIALMKELGVSSYRFSIAWPRIIPNGRGQVNQAGLDFYQRLVEALLEAGIVPAATLYHWDLPLALEDAGGWPMRETAEAFAEYADQVTRVLGDRVPFWITHNEPWCAAFLGYREGIHAPGRRDPAAALAASHHLLLSHGLAVPIIRRNSPHSQVGITLNLTSAYPASEHPADYERFRWVDGDHNRWFLDPLYGRGYPADMLANAWKAGNLDGRVPSWLHADDLATIATPTDFLGVNYYTRALCQASGPAKPIDAEYTDIGWEVYPQGLEDLLRRIHLDYRIPALYITENGASYNDGPDPSGVIDDQRRIAYLQSHLAAASRAIESGVPLKGYYLWSLLDNFEWAEGYSQRFGIVHVDYESQERRPKASAWWYRDLISGK